MSERPLRDWEIAEARLVFADSLNYTRVRVHENATWTNVANELGMRLKRIPPPTQKFHNAITLGNHCYFPVALPPTLEAWQQSYRFGWLLHELTHAWQYQHIGWNYLPLALIAQFRYRAATYDYGGAQGLAAAIQAGKSFSSFNPEQQGAIVQSYYERQCANQDATAWNPFINEIQSRA